METEKNSNIPNNLDVISKFLRSVRIY